MDQRIKNDWLKALRSGEYKQGKEMLRSNKDEFCCLGVLCDLHSKETNSRWGKSGSEAIPYQVDGKNNEGYPPEKVLIWAGLDKNNNFVTIPGTNKTLTSLNDSGGTFEQIASVIEGNL